VIIDAPLQKRWLASATPVLTMPTPATIFLATKRRFSPAVARLVVALDELNGRPSRPPHVDFAAATRCRRAWKCPSGSAENGRRRRCESVAASTGTGGAPVTAIRRIKDRVSARKRVSA
jgi:hypothetical protein